MRKIIAFNMTSVDGYYAGTDGNIDWHNADDEFMEYGVKVLKGIDTMLFGRITYDLYESYWPQVLTDSTASAIDRAAAKLINNAHKIVFSTSKKQPYWQNSELCSAIDAQEIRQIKKQKGKHIIICGSGTVVRQLAKSGLIDEYQCVVVPVVLGEGKSLLGRAPQTKLKTVKTKVFDSGNTLVVYQNK